MQPSLKTKTNDMPTAGWSFIPACYQHFCPKLCTVPIIGQLQSREGWKKPTRVVRFSDSEISFNNTSLLATTTATSKRSSREDRVLPPGSSEVCQGAAVGMLCCTRKWWASVHWLCSLVAKGEVKKPFWVEGALETDVLH